MSNAKSGAVKIQEFRNRQADAGRVRVEFFIPAALAGEMNAWRLAHGVKSRNEAAALLLQLALTVDTAAAQARHRSSGTAESHPSPGESAS